MLIVLVIMKCDSCTSEWKATDNFPEAEDTKMYKRNGSLRIIRRSITLLILHIKWIT
jgi:hypothetical protein